MCYISAALWVTHVTFPRVTRLPLPLLKTESSTGKTSQETKQPTAKRNMYSFYPIHRQKCIHTGGVGRHFVYTLGLRTRILYTHRRCGTAFSLHGGCFCIHIMAIWRGFISEWGSICESFCTFISEWGLFLGVRYQHGGNLYPKSTIIWEPMQGGVGGIMVRTICIMRCLTPVSPVYI